MRRGREVTVFERIQAEVEEIAWVLARERGLNDLVAVWREALSLHRVRYEVDPAVDGGDLKKPLSF